MTSASRQPMLTRLCCRCRPARSSASRGNAVWDPPRRQTAADQKPLAGPGCARPGGVPRQRGGCDIATGLCNQGQLPRRAPAGHGVARSVVGRSRRSGPGPRSNTLAQTRLAGAAAVQALWLPDGADHGSDSGRGCSRPARAA